MNVDSGEKIWIAGSFNSTKEIRKQQAEWPWFIQLN